MAAATKILFCMLVCFIYTECFVLPDKCSLQSCPQILCDNGMISEVPAGECCPICKDKCSLVRCAEVLCQNGKKPIKPPGKCCSKCPDKCMSSLCLQPVCEDNVKPITPPSECCSQCPNPCKDSQGNMHQHGILYKDDCQMCQCNNGDSSCLPMICPALYCEQPMVSRRKRDSCCPVCRRRRSIPKKQRK